MLTELKCRSAAPGPRAVKLFDGGGLHLLIKPTGYKSWRLKYRWGGKEKQLAFGPYPLISLREAREMRDEAKRELLQGRDPGRAARERRAKRTGQSAGGTTFRTAALRWHKLQAHGWKKHHAADVLTKLENEVFPGLGDLLLGDITAADIRPVIDAMQERGAVDQAHRSLMRIVRIFDLAVVDQLVGANPASSLGAILRPVPKHKYPAILDLQVARAALKAFEEERHQPTTLLASRLLALTAARPGPLRFATPAEFQGLDGPEPRWVIPAANMKLDRAESEQANMAFTIPLSRQAVETVRAALEFAGDRALLFPSVQYATRPISENALNAAYRKSPGFYGRHVPHGWRSTFSTVMNERAADRGSDLDRPVIDLMLAHKPKGTESRYNRAAYMARRRELAQEWADLLTEGLKPAAALLDALRN